MIKLGVIGSTRGTDLQFIIDAIKSEKIDAQVAVVISNRKAAYILERARINEIPSIYIPHKNKERELKVDSIDLMLTEKCSLKCKDCSNLMQFYAKPVDEDFEIVIKTLKKIFI